MKKVQPVSAADVLKGLFKRWETEKVLTKEDIEAYWEKAVGVDGSKHSRPARLRNEILMVIVDSSPWMQSLVMRKRKILKDLRKHLGRNALSDIHFKIGE